MGPEFEKGDGRLRPSLQQRLPGAEGPPEGNRPTPRRLRRSYSQLAGAFLFSVSLRSPGGCGAAFTSCCPRPTEFKRMF